jgi:hypothetical protein
MEARKGTARMQVDNARVAVQTYLTGNDFLKYVEIAKKDLHGAIDSATAASLSNRVSAVR